MDAASLALRPGVEDAIRAHAREAYPHECCGALIGRERCGAGDVRAAQYDRGRTAAPVPRAAGRLSRGRAATRRRWVSTSSGSTIHIPTTPRARRSTTSTTRGRSSRTSSFRRRLTAPARSHRGASATTAARSTKNPSLVRQMTRPPRPIARPASPETADHVQPRAHSHTAPPVHRQAGGRRGLRRNRWRAARRPHASVRRAQEAPLHG